MSCMLVAVDLHKKKQVVVVDTNSVGQAASRLLAFHGFDSSPERSDSEKACLPPDGSRLVFLRSSAAVRLFMARSNRFPG